MKYFKKLIFIAWALAGLHAHANLVQNPGFETGNFTDWTVSGQIGVFSGGAHSGTYSASFDDALSAGFLDQNIATTPGDIYDISFWLFSDTEGGINFSGSFGGDTFYSVNDLSGSPYTQITANGVSGTGSSTLLHLTFQDVSPDSFGALDDISVTDVTAAGVPDIASTAGLLGLGLVGLMTLRRSLSVPVSAG
jgi:hypothetical protein